MTYQIATPHDTYFQTTMENLEVARAFFMGHLLSEVREELDWSTLKLADAVRRLPNKKPLYTDITYVCYTKGKNVPIYLHVEQERNIDPFILERILQYNLGLFIKHRKQKNKKLPIIANFVLYNGNKRKKYPYHENTYDYFEIPWIAKLLMGRYFFLINLNVEPDLTLVTHSSSAMMELLLKRGGDGNFIIWLKENHKLVKDVIVYHILSASIEYVLQVNKADPEEIIEEFSKIYPQFKDTIMTAARKLEKRGEKLGIQKGIEKGTQNEKLAIAKNMLKNGEFIEKIMRYTGLSKEAIEDLKKG